MITEALGNAIENDAIIRVRYFGGSAPGKEREIQPISVKEGKVRALCLLSREIKTFIVEKMELIVDGMPSQLASTLPTPVTIYDSFDEFCANQIEPLKALRWVVQREGETISLHRTFKNGKLIKSPVVELLYEALSYDTVFDGEQVTQSNYRERSRPWSVRAMNQTTRSYGDFGKAQITFLEFARSLSPSGGSHNTRHGNH
jgi:hypothetical protein